MAHLAGKEIKGNKHSITFYTLFEKSLHIALEKIFFSLDYKSYKTCLEVSMVWKELLTSKSFQRKGKSVFSKELLKDGICLWTAANAGNIDNVNKIISTGMVDVNVVDDDKSALCIATINGHKDIVNLLIEQGADLNKKDFHGKTPLDHAAERGKFDIVCLLLDSGAKSPLVTAVRGGQISTVRLLLQAGDNPNKPDANGDTPHTPLTMAVYLGNKDIVQILLQGGAKHYLGNMYDYTPLHFAASGGHIAIAKILLEAGAKLDTTTIWGDTPLFNAVYYDEKEMVQFLIDSGADQTVASEDGQTPLSLAQEKGFSDIVNILSGQPWSRQQEPPTSPRWEDMCNLQ